MYRLLIVDDEEIIAESLYEVFSQSLGDELDIYKAFSAKEALSWLARTRIDIVLSDIRMPGMSGLELMEEIKTYWPRCRIVFLTGYSEFEYAYQAIQNANVKYLLKTEGYDKVLKTVRDVMEEISFDHQVNNLIKQSEEQKVTLNAITQGEYFRSHLLDHAFDGTKLEELQADFDRLHINFSVDQHILMVLAHLSYDEGPLTYAMKKERLSAVKGIWHSLMSSYLNDIVVEDKQGDLLWLLQPRALTDEKFTKHIHTFIEGTLEMIQQTCLESLNVAVSFTMSGEYCAWDRIETQYDRLRQLQRMRIGEHIPLLQIDYANESTMTSPPEAFRIGQRAEVLSVYLDSGRRDEFFASFHEIETYVLSKKETAARSTEAYYAVALALLSYLNRYHLHDQISQTSKLMRLDEHPSMKIGFRYLHEIAGQIFANKRSDEHNRASLIIEKICKYIQEHLSEDLSLVRLAEIHYFNPSYLSRFFKQERGVKLSEYIDDCRARKAKELLSNPELKIRDVSLLVGYEAAHSFTRFFKKATGMTPQEFRDLLIVEQ